MPNQTRDRGRISFTPDELNAMDRDRMARGMAGDERRARGWDGPEQLEQPEVDGMRTLAARRARALARDDDSAVEFVHAGDLARQARMEDARPREERMRSEPPRTYRAEAGISYDQYRRTRYYEEPRYGAGQVDHFARIHRDAEGIRRSAENIRQTFRAPRGYTRSDDRIMEDVWNSLLNTTDIDGSDIDVSVQNGEVTLRGSVESREDKFRAEEAADRVNGVLEIHNQLHVTPRAES